MTTSSRFFKLILIQRKYFIFFIILIHETRNHTSNCSFDDVLNNHREYNLLHFFSYILSFKMCNFLIGIILTIANLYDWCSKISEFNLYSFKAYITVDQWSYKYLKMTQIAIKLWKIHQNIFSNCIIQSNIISINIASIYMHGLDNISYSELTEEKQLNTW